MVPQQAYLFSGTVADNLRFGRAEATDEELWQALEVAQAARFRGGDGGWPRGRDHPRRDERVRRPASATRRLPGRS